MPPVGFQVIASYSSGRNCGKRSWHSLAVKRCGWQPRRLHHVEAGQCVAVFGMAERSTPVSV